MSAGLDIGESVATLAGRSQTASGAYHAFAWDEIGPCDLGTLGGAQSAAHAANRVIAVSQAQLLSGQERAFSVNVCSGQPMVNLGTLGGTWSAAYDVRSTVVGASRTAGDA